MSKPMEDNLKKADVQLTDSNNLYQIFTYVKNKAATGCRASGLILYAKTDEKVQPDQSYLLSGNRVDVGTLDLNCDFSEIKAQLNEIADRFMEEAGETRETAAMA